MVGGLIVPPLLVVPFGTPDADHYKQVRPSRACPVLLQYQPAYALPLPCLRSAALYLQYLVQAAMIVTGIMTIFQVWGGRPLTRCGLPNFQWGAGVLSVMGISFTTLPIAQSVIATLSKVRCPMGTIAWARTRLPCARSGLQSRSHSCGAIFGACARADLQGSSTAALPRHG